MPLHTLLPFQSPSSGSLEAMIFQLQFHLKDFVTSMSDMSAQIVELKSDVQLLKRGCKMFKAVTPINRLPPTRKIRHISSSSSYSERSAVSSPPRSPSTKPCFVPDTLFTHSLDLLYKGVR